MQKSTVNILKVFRKTENSFAENFFCLSGKAFGGRSCKGEKSKKGENFILFR